MDDMLLQHCVEVWYRAKGVADWGGGNYRGITWLHFSREVYSKVLERRVQLLVKPWIEEEQCRFHPGHETIDHLFILATILEGAWEFAAVGCLGCVRVLYSMLDLFPVGFGLHPGAESGPGTEIISLHWPWNALGSLSQNWLMWPGKGRSGAPAETAASATRPWISCWWMDGWMDKSNIMS